MIKYILITLALLMIGCGGGDTDTVVKTVERSVPESPDVGTLPAPPMPMAVE